MKASLAGALSGWQGMGSDDSCERPVDRVAAAGAIQIAKAKEAERTADLCGLGVDLVAWKYGGRDTSGRDAIDMLAMILAWPSWKLKTTAKERDVIAWWAATEWKLDGCIPCTGSGIYINVAGVVGTCPACGGSRRRRYGDDERVEAMGAPYTRAMDVAHRILGWAEGLAVDRARDSLERR